MPSARAEIAIRFDDASLARTTYGALLPETDDGPDDRGRNAINLKGDTLNITVEGNDSAAFRAGINSYGRWLKLMTALMDKE